MKAPHEASLQMLADEPIYEDLASQLRPGGLKARWLGYWLNERLNQKLADHQLILRSGFNLALQDNLRDSFQCA